MQTVREDLFCGGLSVKRDLKKSTGQMLLRAPGQFVIKPFLRHQFLMGPLFGNPLIVGVEDAVRIPDGGQAVGHDESGLPFQHHIQRFLDQQFRLRVDGAGGFVQNHDGRILQHNPGKADQLPLTGGQAAAQFLQHMVISAVQPLDEFIREYHPGGFLALLIGGVPSSVPDIVQNGPLENSIISQMQDGSIGQSNMVFDIARLDSVLSSLYNAFFPGSL